MAESLDTQIVDAWNNHNRILMYLFDQISPEGFQGKPQGMSGRSVGKIYSPISTILVLVGLK